MIHRLIIVLTICAAVFLFIGCVEPVIKSDFEEVYATDQFDQALVDSYEIDLSRLYRVMQGDMLEVLYHFKGSQDEEYILMPRDVIAVKFPEAPNLNEQQVIRPDGRISLPYLGEVIVGGNTPQKVAKELKGRYAGVLETTELYVVVIEFGAAIEEFKQSIQNYPRGQSKLITVRSDGFMTLPLIGDIKASGKTIPELTDTANQAYKPLTDDLQVDLLLSKAEGARIAVLGEVNQPGYYQINRPLNIFEVLALGNGLTNHANRETVLTVRRTENNKIRYKVINVNRILSSDPQGLMNLLGPNDIVYVSKTKIADAAIVARDISSILFFRGWGVTFGYTVDDINF